MVTAKLGGAPEERGFVLALTQPSIPEGSGVEERGQLGYRLLAGQATEGGTWPVSTAKARSSL